MAEEHDFKWHVDKFADITVLRYKVPFWESLPINAKKLAYYLIEAGRCGFDIIWDQNYKHNLTIRNALIKIWKNRSNFLEHNEWLFLEEYIKQVCFANGIHHHYSNEKFKPRFSRVFFETCLTMSDTNMTKDIVDIIFDPNLDNKKVEQNEDVDVVANSCVNFYETGIKRDDVTAFYADKIDKNDPTPISYGLNSKLTCCPRSIFDCTFRDPKDKCCKLQEDVYKVGGLYGKALEQIVLNLEKACEFAPPNMADRTQTINPILQDRRPKNLG